MQNVLTSDTVVIGAIITGLFTIVVLFAKYYLDRKRSNEVQHHEQTLKVMHLWGRINALLDDRESDSAKSLMDLSDELKKIKSDPALIGWMIGQLEVLLERATAARDEKIELEREGKDLEHQKRTQEYQIKQYKKYYLSLFEQYQEERQKRIDEGEEIPDLPKWMYEMAKRAKQD